MASPGSRSFRRASSSNLTFLLHSLNMALSMRVNFTSLLPSTSGCAQSIYAHPSSSQGPKTPTGLISHNPKPSSWEPPVHNNRKRPRSEAFHTSEDSRDSKRAKAEAPGEFPCGVASNLASVLTSCPCTVLQATAPVSSLYEAPVSPRNDTQQEPSSSGWANNFFDDDPWLAGERTRATMSCRLDCSPSLSDLASPDERRFLPLAAYEGRGEYLVVAEEYERAAHCVHHL